MPPMRRVFVDMSVTIIQEPLPEWPPGEITDGHHDEEIFLNRGATALRFEIGPVLTSSLTTQTAGGGVGISRCTALIHVLPEFM
jgi:hypothetical protein